MKAKKFYLISYSRTQELAMLDNPITRKNFIQLQNVLNIFFEHHIISLKTKLNANNCEI